MGVITKEPRSATLEVTENAPLLSLSKIRFDALIRQDIDMNFKIYKNLLESLSQKVRDNNAQIIQSALDSDHELAAFNV